MNERALFDGTMILFPGSVREGAVAPDCPLKWHELHHDGPDPVTWAVSYVREYEEEDANLRAWCDDSSEPVESTPCVFTVAPDGVSLIAITADLVNGESRFHFIRFGTGWTEDEKRNVLNAFRRDGR